MLRRLFSFVSAFAVLFFCSVPAFAVEVGGVGIPIVGNINLDVVDLFDYMQTNFENNSRWLVNTVGHKIDEDICPNAPQLGGGHNFVPRRTLKDGQIGKYYVCEYCGKAYGEAMEEAYQEYVDTLPGQKVNSDGTFYWSPEFRGFSLFCNEFDWYKSPIRISFAGDSSGRALSVLSFWDGSEISDDELVCILNPPSGGASLQVAACMLYFGGIVPVSGYYQVVSFHGVVQFLLLDEPARTIFPSLPSSSAFYSVGTDFQVQTDGFAGVSHRGLSGSISWDLSLPVYLVRPVVSLSSSGGSFSSDSRPSIFADASGDNSSLMLGYMENGNLVQSQSESAVFAEDSSIYVNPVTNNTKTVTSWNYDYADRSYNLTTEEGDEITVTYGDTNLTINEGENTYNLYYLTEHDDNVPCSHSYSGQITQAPTCTSGGVKTYTCSACGESYTQELPAMGHSYSSSVTQAATCTASGVRTSVCSVCGDTRTEAIPATGHSYSSEVITAPTCTASGVGTSVCSVCGDTHTETIPATGHNYVSEVTMEPTCVTTGVKTFTCSVCGDSYNRSIPATGHRWRIFRTVPSQYGEGGELTQAGYTLYECETCGEQYRIDASSSGSELPMASSDGASTGTGTDSGGNDAGDGDSDVGAGFLLTIARGLTKDLPEVLKMVSEWFTKIPALFDGYGKFLAASFSWLPKDCVMLIAFGVHMVILLGVLKACFRR